MMRKEEEDTDDDKEDADDKQDHDVDTFSCISFMCNADHYHCGDTLMLIII